MSGEKNRLKLIYLFLSLSDRHESLKRGTLVHLRSKVGKMVFHSEFLWVRQHMDSVAKSGEGLRHVPETSFLSHLIVDSLCLK